jgi:hypothetical protein
MFSSALLSMDGATKKSLRIVSAAKGRPVSTCRNAASGFGSILPIALEAQPHTEQPSTTNTQPSGIPIAKPATPATPAVAISLLGPFPQIQNVTVTARPAPTIIAFDVNSASLTVESRKVLDVASRAFNDSLANYRFLLEGRADQRGSERSYSSARRRAEAVRDYLASRGVNAQRMVIDVVDDPVTVWADSSGNRSVVTKAPEVTFNPGVHQPTGATR